MKAIKELALELIKATKVNDVAKCLELSKHLATSLTSVALISSIANSFIAFILHFHLVIQFLFLGLLLIYFL